MVKAWRSVHVAFCGVFAFALTGCSKAQPSIPGDFCHVTVDKSVLAPLVPNGDDLTQKYTPFQSHPGAQCDLSVDGRGVLSVSVNRWDRAPDPTDWNKVASPYKYGAQRKVAFPGHASIGSDRAVVEATCKTRTAYVSVVVDFWGDRVEDTPSGYKKLLRFVNDFVPRQTKNLHCTD